jgi:hypothetical protein
MSRDHQRRHPIDDVAAIHRFGTFPARANAAPTPKLTVQLTYDPVHLVYEGKLCGFSEETRPYTDAVDRKREVLTGLQKRKTPRNGWKRLACVHLAGHDAFQEGPVFTVNAISLSYGTVSGYGDSHVSTSRRFRPYPYPYLCH